MKKQTTYCYLYFDKVVAPKVTASISNNIITGTVTNEVTLKTGWMHLSNNVDLTSWAHEWTISRLDLSSYDYLVWVVDAGGRFNS